MRLKPHGTIIQNSLRLRNFVERLLFWVIPIVIGMIVDEVTRFNYEWMDVFICSCVRALSLKWISCPLNKSILFYTGESSHMLENWVIPLSHISLSMYPDGVWWNFQSNGMLWWRSWDYSLDWQTIMGGMKHCPSALVSTIKVHQNGARSPVCTFHIISPWKNF